MPSILPPTSDKQAEAHHVCPTCGTRAKTVVDRVTGVGTLNSDCLCTQGHIWSVHWLGGAA